MKNLFKKDELPEAVEGVEAQEETAAVESIEELKQRIVVLESEKAQLLALPPELRKREDPSPTTESRRSTNQSAYDADVAGFLNK